ncbi:MAG TPA: ribosome assembly factor SBDS [Methanomicrobiales archaeon]|jgi:ribosome maturation protein SDO1|nr:ribosome assembly factor SBDS [Methanomicrobiales archaeon]
MIPLDRAVVARLETHGERFEILVDPDLATKIRHGEAVDIEDAVAAIFIFENASRAEKSSDEALQKVFQTTDFSTIARRIIEKGEIHLTAEQRRHLLDEKRGQVITYIARHAINPQTGLPHPPARIEMAMEEAKVSIDPFKALDELVAETMKALRPLIPIRFEEVRVAVKIPADHAAKAYGDIDAFARIEQEEWQKDGSWICVVKIPGGMQQELESLVRKVSKGTGQVRVL